MTTGRIILLAAALCASGLAIGWLTFPSRPTTPPKNQDGQAEERHCFALTAADVKLDRERPSLAVSGDSVVLAWASQTSEQEYTLFLARSADRGKTFADPTPFQKFAAFQVKSRMRRPRDDAAQRRTAPAVCGRRAYHAGLDGAWPRSGSVGGKIHALPGRHVEGRRCIVFRTGLHQRRGRPTAEFHCPGCRRGWIDYCALA